MSPRVRGRPHAGLNCLLCGRPLLAHGITEFCKERDAPRRATIQVKRKLKERPG